MNAQKKMFVSDNSSLVEEMVAQVNDSVFTNSFYHYMNTGETTCVILGVGERGVLLKDVILGFNFLDTDSIASPDTTFIVELAQNGNFSGPLTEILYRQGFDTTPIVGGTLRPLKNIPATTERGHLPVFIPPLSQIRVRIDNQEGVDWEITIHVVGRPTEYEIVSRPTFRRKV